MPNLSSFCEVVLLVLNQESQVVITADNLGFVKFHAGTNMQTQNCYFGQNLFSTSNHSWQPVCGYAKNTKLDGQSEI